MYLSTKHIILDVNEEEARQFPQAEPKAQEEDGKVDEEKVAQVEGEGWPREPERRKPSNFRQESPPLIFPPRMRAKLPGGYSVDVPFEASKLPLDVAVFNSTRGLKNAEQR
jgi:actin-related protein 8